MLRRRTKEAAPAASGAAEPESRAERGLTVMIPLGGIGSRFQKEGYTQPKPFISVLGKPMILWVLDSLSLLPIDDLVIVYDPSFIPPKFWSAISDRYPQLTLVTLPGPTRGAAETVLIGLKALPQQVRAKPVVLLDGDAFYDVDVVSAYRELAAEAHGVFYFPDTKPAAIYSYIVFDEATALISQVKEKVKISDAASTGCYCFMSGRTLENQCQALLDGELTQISQDGVGEFYTSGVIAQMIEEGERFRAMRVETADYHVLGTPALLEAFCRAQPKQPKIRVCFDLDGTLVTAPRFPGDYSSCEPIAKNVEARRPHKSLTRVSRTSRSHESLAQVAHTSRSHKSLTQVARTSHSHKSLAQVAHTSRSHKSLTQVSHTSLSHKSLTQVSHVFPDAFPTCHTPISPLYIYQPSLLLGFYTTRSAARFTRRGTPSLSPPRVGCAHIKGMCPPSSQILARSRSDSCVKWASPTTRSLLVNPGHNSTSTTSQ